MGTDVLEVCRLLPVAEAGLVPTTVVVLATVPVRPALLLLSVVALTGERRVAAFWSLTTVRLVLAGSFAVDVAPTGRVVFDLMRLFRWISSPAPGAVPRTLAVPRGTPETD